MNLRDREHMEARLELHRSNLRRLEIRASQLGFEAPFSLQNQIDEERSQIGALDQQLRADTIEIDLISYHNAAPAVVGERRLDWSEFFLDALPTPEIWQQRLLPSLRALYTELNSKSPRFILLRAKAHPATGIAFGYTFRQPTGFAITVEQPIPDGTIQQWPTYGAAAAELALRQDATPLDPDGTAISVELSLTPYTDVRLPVSRAIEQFALPIRERIHFAPADSTAAPAIRNGAHARAVANRVREVIRQARNTAPIHSVHLFGAMPFGLAVLIGAQLNTCEPIQCYDLDRSKTPQAYALAALLSP